MSAQRTTPQSGRALVTGGAGFIGSHVVELLVGEGWQVLVVDDLSTGNATNVPSGVPLEVVDISDRAAFDSVVDAFKPEAIFHLGAQSSVTVSVKDPGRDCAVNVQGTLHVLEAATRHKAPLVFTSTGGALYGNEAPIPTPETRIPAPISPYGASKWAGEAYIVTWREATGIGHSVCRLGNVYGPRQSPHGEAGVVSIFSHMLWQGQAPKLFGFGKPTRDYVHVHDVARAMRAALGKGGTYNISTGVETAVDEVFNALQAAAGTHVDPERVDLRAGELERSCMNNSKARTELDWAPQVELSRGLTETYAALVAGFEAASPQSA
jgi:UDP-glucose 4-epimerase